MLSPSTVSAVIDRRFRRPSPPLSFRFLAVQDLPCRDWFELIWRLVCACMTDSLNRCEAMKPCKLIDAHRQNGRRARLMPVLWNGIKRVSSGEELGGGV